MENEDELETELETELGGTSEEETSSVTSPSESAAPANGEGTAEVNSENDAGPKSLAEALSAGIDAVAKKSEKKSDSVDGKGKEKEEPADKGKSKEKDAAGQPKDEGKDKNQDGKGKFDHVNDPIDARLAPRTQERIRSLADEVKTLRQVSQDNGQVLEAVMQTGATPQEFGALLGYMKWTHSEKAEDLEEAYKLLQSELQGVALRLGRAVPEIDWLSGHQDLIDNVRAGAMTRESAVELAMYRANQKRTQTVAKAKNDEKATQQSTAAQREQERTTATADLDALGDELSKQDPQYQAKYEVIVPKLVEEFKTLPPGQWKGRFLELYAKTFITPKATISQASSPPVKQVKNQPLRPSAPSGSTQKAPGSALDALSSAIDGMRG